MGHLVGKDIYRDLGRKIDGLTVRAPWNEALRAILKELYSEEEADLVIRMPYSLATLDRLERVTRYERARLERVLDGLCTKGLVLDIALGGEYRYMLSPIVIGIFEFTMMRTGDGLNTKEWGRLFHEYIESGALWRANASGRGHLLLMRSRGAGGGARLRAGRRDRPVASEVQRRPVLLPARETACQGGRGRWGGSGGRPAMPRAARDLHVDGGGCRLHGAAEAGA